MFPSPGNFLKEVIALTRRRVEEAQRDIPLPELKSMIKRLPPPRDFLGAIRAKQFFLIAEIKRASPSEGLLCPDVQADVLARKYAQGGASALSVLTEPYFFKGSLEDLRKAKEACDLPVLRKDFIISTYQIYESRFWGADAVLLIASILSEVELKGFLSLCRELNLSALVEVHNEHELFRALGCGAGLIGINNRDLNSLEVDPETVFRLFPMVGEGVVVVAESGISSSEEIRRLKAIGVHGALIGKALVTSPDPEEKIRRLIYG